MKVKVKGKKAGKAGQENGKRPHVPLAQILKGLQGKPDDDDERGEPVDLTVDDDIFDD